MSKNISDEERQLFRQSVGHITPLEHNNVVPVKTRKKPPLRLRETEINLLKVEVEQRDPLNMSDVMWFSRSGINERQLKKLRQGKIPREALCDLHGLTLEQARLTLEHFIAQALNQNLRCVLIIHGKGYRSEHQQPKLKNLAHQLLQELADVLAFCSAQINDGGTGAVYVLLKAQ